MGQTVSTEAETDGNPAPLLFIVRKGETVSYVVNVEEQVAAMIESVPIRQVVDLHPEVMPILAGHGVDLCCGGGHTIAEAIRMHGLDGELVTAEIAAALVVQARG